MVRPSDVSQGTAAECDRSWSRRDHAVFVATVALGPLLSAAQR
jgi:hypothetical protein